MIVKDRILDFFHYSTKNILFLIFVIAFMYFFDFLEAVSNNTFLMFLFSLPLAGYSLDIVKDTIKGGTQLPKINHKKIIIRGFKYSIVSYVFLIPNFVFLYLITFFTGFSFSFDFTDIIFHINEIIFDFSLDPIVFIIFFFSFCFVSYITIFFYEMSIAILADTDSLLSAFNIKEILRVINNIGFTVYILDYTELIFTISLLWGISYFVDYLPGFSTLFSILIFLIQSRAIGLIYRKSLDL